MAAGNEALAGAYAVATILGLLLGGVLWRHREKTGAVPMAVAVFGMVVWSGSLLVAVIADDYAVSAFLHRFLYVGVVVAVLGAFLFKLEYTGREHLVSRTTIGVLSIEPIAVVALAFWNPRNLFFESIGPDPTALTGVALEWGIAFEVHLVYSYALSIVGTAMLLEFLYSSRALYRGQAAALFAGSLVPLAMNALHIFTSIGADTTPVGFALVSALYSFAIVRYRLIDVAPIARDRVLDTVSEGVFVVDRDDQLIDVNPAGRGFIDADDSESLVGRGVDSLFADDPDVRETYHDLTETPDESRTELAYDGSHYEVYATPIDDGRDRHVGWLVLASDITERKHREERLRQQNERLDQFASLVSHDLRNPLTVADGYVDLARETGDLSQLDEVDRSLERMETIIDDVLTLAREGDADTEPEPVSLARLAERAWEGVETGDASLSIETDVTIHADPERTMRLLENLFRNSIEHGAVPARSSVTADDDDGDDDGDETGVDEPPSLAISVGASGDTDSEREDGETGAVEGFYVADDGVGIPDDAADRLFEDGYTTGDGTGLGLSIVAEIAKAHGWSVAATASESGGARFEFTGLETVKRDGRPSAAR